MPRGVRGGAGAVRRLGGRRAGGGRAALSGKPAAFHRVPNSAVAQALQEVADILEIEGESTFRVRAYRSAAQYLGNLGRPVAEIAAEGGRKALMELPSVGASIADKILEILATGRLGKLQALRREVPPELSGLLAIPGLGPKKLHLLHESLGVRRLDDLERALASGAAAALPGFGERSCAKLRDAVAVYRRRETVGDLDLLAVAADPQVGARWIPPELRENRGEIEAAIKGTLPELIEVADLRPAVWLRAGSVGSL